ncbi:hypothetical protein ACHAXT_000708 [Thalassiosira profunda]
MRVGDFTVELVRADTKQAFQEHTAPDGRVFAEVEPDVQYYVSMRSAIGGFMYYIAVDGVGLGFHSFRERPTTRCDYSGCWKKINGTETMKALRFSKTREKGDGETLDMVTGKVEVHFYELGTKIFVKNQDVPLKKLSGETKSGGKKCVATSNGSSSHIGRRRLSCSEIHKRHFD